MTGLAARGDGLTADGRFVPGALPGDQVGDDGEIARGPGHATPACHHFGRCGGCQLQHASDAVYADFTVDRILRPLAAVGIVPAEIMPVALSPPHSRRRASLRAVKSGREVALGFNAEGSHDLIDLAECPVLNPALFALLAPLRGLLPPLMRERQTVGVTVTRVDQGVDLLLANLSADGLRAREALTAFAQAHGLARLSVEGPAGVETVIDAGATVTLGGIAVALPPGGFLQATAQGEAALVSAVLAGVGPARRVADLFAGAGTFALPLSATAHVEAADAAGPAIEALKAAARAAGRPVKAVHRDLFRRPYTAAELDCFEALVIDPPRAGAAAQTAEIAASAVPRVMAVSCNPATFARDAERLVKSGFTLGRLWPVAQFRWSTHVELAALFLR